MRLRLLTLTLLLAACQAPAAKVRVRTQRLPSYSIGTTQETFVDTSRITPANGSEPEHPERTLTADVWYPARVDNDTGGVHPEGTLDPRGAPYPLVVFVHGSQGLSVQSTFLMEALASKGYVVVAANHPLTWFFTPGGSSDKHSDMEVGDVSFIASQMYALSTQSSSEIFNALEPAEGYGVVGHSTGGTVALATAFSPKEHDDRIKTVVGLAPDACFFSEAFFHTRSLPMMVIAGTDDGYVPPGDNGVKAYDLALGEKRLALLSGGTHLAFTDIDMPDNVDTPDSDTSDITLAFEAAVGSKGDCSLQPAVGTDPRMPFATQQALTESFTTAFLDKFLYEDAAALSAIDVAPPAGVDWRR